MSEKFRSLLLQVMRDYIEAKNGPFSGHYLGRVLRRDLPGEINSFSFIQNGDYIIKGSVGQGNWAAIPWLAIMNTHVTTSTQRGVYIVYLFSEDMKVLYLTIAQGVEETPKDEMIKINNIIRKSIEMNPRFKKDDNIILGESKKAKEYEKSVAAYIPYSIHDFPSEEQLISDLKKMIHYYEEFINLEKNIKTPDSETSKKKDKNQEYQLIHHIHKYITTKGYYYSIENIMNLYLSLKSKPFVVPSRILCNVR
jgi:MrcB-like, N-terminal domain